MEIASRDFETEYRKLLAKAQPPVVQKLKGLLKKWSEGEFKSDPQLNLIPSLLAKMKSEGVQFNEASETVIYIIEIIFDFYFIKRHLCLVL